jgi:hypothetical protein
VALAGSWVAAGFGGGGIATWDFAGAADALEAATAAREARKGVRRGRQRGGGGNRKASSVSVPVPAATTASAATMVARRVAVSSSLEESEEDTEDCGASDEDQDTEEEVERNDSEDEARRREVMGRSINASATFPSSSNQVVGTSPGAARGRQVPRPINLGSISPSSGPGTGACRHQTWQVLRAETKNRAPWDAAPRGG